MRDANLEMPLRYLSVFDDSLPSLFCEKLIRKFEANLNKEQNPVVGNLTATTVNVSEHWEDEHQTLLILLREVRDAYMRNHHQSITSLFKDTLFLL